MCFCRKTSMKAEKINDEESMLELRTEAEFDVLVEGVIEEMWRWTRGHKCR